jgi:hypothetical protein
LFWPAAALRQHTGSTMDTETCMDRVRLCAETQRPTHGLLLARSVPILNVRSSPSPSRRHGSCLWHSKVGCGHCIHGSDEA